MPPALVAAFITTDGPEFSRAAFPPRPGIVWAVGGPPAWKHVIPPLSDRLQRREGANGIPAETRRCLLLTVDLSTDVTEEFASLCCLFTNNPAVKFTFSSQKGDTGVGERRCLAWSQGPPALMFAFLLCGLGQVALPL